MSYFGIPIRNGLPIGLGSLTALATSKSSPPATYKFVVTDAGDQVVTDAGDIVITDTL
jgi:hypothetical protein